MMYFYVMSLIAAPIATFPPVSVIMSPAVTCVLASLRFVMFYSNFTICDVALESTINVLLSFSWFDVLR